MQKQFNLIIEGKLITVFESDFQTAEKTAYQIVEEMKRLSED